MEKVENLQENSDIFWRLEMIKFKKLNIFETQEYLCFFRKISEINLKLFQVFFNFFTFQDQKCSCFFYNISEITLEKFWSFFLANVWLLNSSLSISPVSVQAEVWLTLTFLPSRAQISDSLPTVKQLTRLQNGVFMVQVKSLPFCSITSSGFTSLRIFTSNSGAPERCV